MQWLAEILSQVGQWAVAVIETLGYPGITVLMTLESMIVPLPSELVMPFAGFLAEEGKMNLGWVVFFSVLGSLIGSLISYAMGYYGGNKLVLKFGKYLLLDVTDLEKTEEWFKKRGEKTIAFGRMIPVVRHLISIPAGIGKMELKRFCLYTLLGATVWNGFLAYSGYILREHWDTIRHYSEYVSITVAVALFLGGSYFIYRHVKDKKQEKKALRQLGNL